MANIPFYRGGTPVVKYIWDENTTPDFVPPFSENNNEDTPPYDSHADGAYNLGHFVLGMPIKPNGAGMTWQRKKLANQTITAGDVIQLAWLPADHIATFLNLKSVQVQDDLAGAKIALVAQKLTFDDDGNPVYTEDSDFDAAVQAQVGANSFNLNEPFNAFVSLFKKVGDDGYAVPMYSEPSLPAKDSAAQPTKGFYYVFGIKVLALPTNASVSLASMRKGVYFSVHMDAFECPTNY